jgi:hypothetical protein
LLLFVVLSLALTYPLPLHLGNAVEDRQDALLNVWITAWDGHQLLDDPLHLFDANIFYPYPRTLAYSELLLGNALLALPVTAVSGNPVLGYNAALLLSFILSGLGTFLLVRRLTGSAGAGLVAGAIFCFSSYRMTNLAQAQLLTTQWLPFALLALHQLMCQRRPRHVLTFVLFFCLQVLSSFYYGILLALAVVAFVAWHLIADERGTGGQDSGAPVQQPWGLLKDRSLLGSLVAAAVGCTLILLPFALPYFQVQAELGFERSLADNEPFSASLRQYVMVPTGSVLHGLWLPSDDTPIAGGYPVDALFPGLTALILGAWGLIRGKGRTRWFFLLLLLASGLLSLGPRLYLAPGQAADFDAALPYAWLYAVVPGFKALRAPVRFDALLTLALAALAGYGVTACLPVARGNQRQRNGRSSASRAAIPALAVGLVVLESLVWPAANAELVPVGEQVPPVYRWLAEGAKSKGGPGQEREPILELPMAFSPGGPQLEYQYYSTTHWLTTPDGYSGFVPPKHGQIVYEMQRFPSERSVSLLQAMGVGHVIVHTGRYPPERASEMMENLANDNGLALVKSFETDHVYRVEPRSLRPDELSVRGYLPPLARAGGPYTAYLIVTNRGSRSYAIPPTQVLKPTADWGGDGSATALPEADLPLVTSPDGGVMVVPLELVAPTEPGTWNLVIHQQDSRLEGPVGAWQLEGEVEVGGQGDSSFPVPARLEAWDVPPGVAPGDSLSVHLTWRALGKIDAYYSVYVKLLDSQGGPITGWDGQPRNGEAPTLLWVPGERIDDVVTLTVPAGLLPGEYTVEAGMYRADDLARCLTLNGEGTPVDRVLLGPVQVGP